jgi:hypothetical protein
LNLKKLTNLVYRRHLSLLLTTMMASKKSNETEVVKIEVPSVVIVDVVMGSIEVEAGSEVMEDIVDEVGVVVMGPPEEVAVQMNPNI